MSVFENTGTGFYSLEILHEPVLVDELKWRNLFTFFFYYKDKVKKLPLWRLTGNLIKTLLD